MADEEFSQAWKTRREIELTVTGPVWFVRDGENPLTDTR